jgi:hypothetical protein
VTAFDGTDDLELVGTGNGATGYSNAASLNPDQGS